MHTPTKTRTATSHGIWRRWRAALRTAALSGLLATAPAQADYLAYAVGEQSRLPLPEQIDAIEAKYLLNLEWGAYEGGRSRVAVLPVDNNSAAPSMQMMSTDGQSTVAFSTENVGMVPVNGIEAIVTDVMSRSGRFRLVERTALQSILQEQDLVTSERVSKPSGARTGNVLGAQHLVQVVVTDYESNVSGREGGVGVGALLGRSAGILGGIGLKRGLGRVGLNFRLVDSETSEVVYTKQIESVIKESGLTVGGLGVVGGGALGGFFSGFSRTPVGQAVIAGINKGVYELVKEIGAQPASGSVVRVDGDRIWTNLGGSSVASGDRLEVVSRGEELIDPETGISLGSLDTNIGTVRVVEVSERFSIAKADYIQGEVNRGDRLTSLERPPGLQFASSWQRPKRGKF